MSRRWILAALIVLPLIALALFAFARRPTLDEIAPVDGSTHIPPRTTLQLTFSEPMRPETVTERLVIEPTVGGEIAWQDLTLNFTPHLPWPAGETITVTLRSGARSSLGLPVLGNETWHFEISRSLLVYLWPSDGQADLYAIDLDNGAVMQLTQTENGVLAYDVDEDTADLYYSTRLDARNSALLRLDRTTGEVEELLHCENVLCSFPTLSPDGRQLAYTRAPSNPQSEPFSQQVWVRTLNDRTTDGRLVSDPEHPAGTPHWSPTGLLTFHDRTAGQTMVLNLATDERVSFKNETGEPGTWAPDGTSYIVHEVEFWGNGPMDFTSHLWRFAYPSGEGQDLSKDLSLEDVTPAYSSDGRWVAFGRKHLDAARWTPGSQIWLVTPNGLDAVQLTDTPDFNHADFSWHPDGDWLVFVRYHQTNIVDPPEIWMMAPDGSEAVQLVIGGYAPSWLP